MTTIRCTLALATLLAAGCGFDPVPKLSEFSVTPLALHAGDTYTGSAIVEDDDGDLDGGKMILTVQFGAGTKPGTRELPLHGVGAAWEAGVSLSGAIPAIAAGIGKGTISLQIVDGAGHESNVVSAEIDVQ